MGSSASAQSAKDAKLSKNDATLASLVPGDLVKFHRRGYYHWAVYIGNEDVVHVSEQDPDTSQPGKNLVRASLELSKVQVCVQSFSAVAKSDKASKANERDQDWSPLPNDEIVDRAQSYLGLGTLRYNLLTRNCEHFAKWCRYDRFHSDQVDRLKIYKPKIVMKTASDVASLAVRAFDKTKHKVKIHISKNFGDQGDQEMQRSSSDNNNNKTCAPQSKMRENGKGDSNNNREDDDEVRELETYGRQSSLSLSKV